MVYHANGATIPLRQEQVTQTYRYDQDITMTDQGFRRSGFVFTGWCTSASSYHGHSYPKDSVQRNLTSLPNGKVDLYAQWHSPGSSTLPVEPGDPVIQRMAPRAAGQTDELITYTKTYAYDLAGNRTSFTLVLLLSSALNDCKIITIDASGCTVSLFFWQKFYTWDSLQTIRFLDFSRARFAGSSYGGPCYCEGVLFSMKKIGKYPQYMDPDTYIFLHHLFSLSCFYIQFTPTRKYVGSPLRRDDGTMPKELPCFFPVDRATFLSCIEEWGVQVEGLNAPYPPEELEMKKKRR